MLAVQRGTRLWVWPSGCEAEAKKAGSATTPPVLVELELGDLLVWRGDVQHHGMGYRITNYRVHAYLYAADYQLPPSHIYAPPADGPPAD